MDPEHPVPGAGDGMLLDELPGEAIDALVAAAGREDSPLLSVEVRHLGGAMARRSHEHGALASIDAEFALFAVGIAATPELKAAVEQHVELVRAAMEPWDAGRTYLNFAEKRTDGSRLFPELTLRRLMAIKAKVDPTDRIRSNHPIRPAR
jgi:hypothetical protein